VAVRKTESRLPAGFQASDLGEALVAPDGRCALISFATAPIAVRRPNTYVLFVTDPVLAASAHSYEWTFQESAGPPLVDTRLHGETIYTPTYIGNLRVAVRILNAAAAEQANLALAQEVVSRNAALEALIAAAGTAPGPGIAEPDVARELVNDHSRYYQTATMQSPEAGDGFQQFLFAMVFDGALRRSPAERQAHLDALEQSLNDSRPVFFQHAARGAGLCGIRLALLAMTVQAGPGTPATLLPWTTLREDHPSLRDFGDRQLRSQLLQLPEAARIDLFNLARFPKSNITRCGRILEALRDRSFPGVTFADLLTQLSATRAHRLVEHYGQGPFAQPMGSHPGTAPAILALPGLQSTLLPIKQPARLPHPLQHFLTGAYTAERANLEPSPPIVNGFPLKTGEAAISIMLLDDAGNHHYADINGTRMDYTGSLAKVAAVYAAFDLRCAARQHAADHAFSDTNAFLASFASVIDTSAAVQSLKDAPQGHQPQLAAIFEGFKATGPDRVRFTSAFQSDLDQLDNPHAGRIIRALGYSYINVSMMRGRFFDPLQLNGIWLAGDYSGEQVLESVRVPVANDTVPDGSGQAITTREMSRMFFLFHTGRAFSHVTDAGQRAVANQNMHAVLSFGSFFRNLTSTVQLTVSPGFSDDCCKVGIGTLGPIGAGGPSVISEGAVMLWAHETQVDLFNGRFHRNLNKYFVLCWQNMYHPHSHFDALVRVVHASIGNFLDQQ
jgi:hypothetical protein